MKKAVLAEIDVSAATPLVAMDRGRGHRGRQESEALHEPVRGRQILTGQPESNLVRRSGLTVGRRRRKAMDYDLIQALERLRIGTSNPNAEVREGQEDAIRPVVEGQGHLLPVRKAGLIP